MSGRRVFQGLQKIFLGIILCFGIWGSAQQQHPVRITPVMTPPYSLLLPEIAQSSQDKIQLHILMTDLNEPSHQVSLRFKLLAGTSSSVIAQSTPFVNGLPTQNLLPGQPIILSNLDVRPLFQLQNLAGINPQQYAKPLPQGLYQFCFQVIDQHTRRELSNFSCIPVYLQQYEPPFLTLPKNAEIIQKQNEFQNILFQWMPRQIAPNTQYTFTLKEINDNIRDPHSAFLTARTLWQENTLAPNLFYGIDKTPLITGKRYAWQVKATSANPALPNFSINPNDDTGIYQNNGLSEIFFFDYTEHCALPKFLIAKNQGRGKTQILWSFNQYQPHKQYLVQYRKKDSHKDWAEIKTYAENAFINNLEDLTTYEYRVGASCNQTTDGRVQFAFSDIQAFTTDSKQTQNQNYQCGVMPNIDLENQQLFQGSLGANDTFTAGDFPVTIISAEGNNGIFSGKGYIQVPYLADTKIIVAFQNISINTDRKLINGVLETEYDAEEKNVVEVELFGKLLDDLNSILDKENPTEEDKKRYLDIKNQLDFYISNIDKLDIPEDDKQKFKNIQANIFLASIDDLTDEQKENAKNATQEAQNLYQKYEKEVETLVPRWRNLRVQIEWTNIKTEFQDWDGVYTFKGQVGYLKANDMKTKLDVIYIQEVYYTDPVPDENGKYKSGWKSLNSLHPHLKQNYQSNCYGWVFTGGLYFINISSNEELYNFLIADDYKNLGKPKKNMAYKIGDLLVWDGHIIEATKQTPKGIIWQSKQGSSNIFEGTLKEVLEYNSSWSIDQGSTSKAVLFRPNTNSRDPIMNKNRKKIGTVKKVTNEDHQKIQSPY